jgi:DMSO/TMAO reductase YedYZ molybdopterin-dependent catalytic subunit
LAWPSGAGAAPRPGEITEYQGQKLSPFERNYDNSIKGPQQVDIQAYRLRITGLVDKPLALTYQEILELPSQTRLLKLPCVEGWDETLLFQGVELAELARRAGVRPRAATVIFRAADGYSSALDLAYALRAGLLLAYKINGLTLDAERGFPLQVAVDQKLGYKWVKWVVEVEFSDQPHLGYWEKRGYSDQADAPKP